MQLQLQLMLWPTLVLLLPDLNGRAVIKFISHARKQNKLHLKFKLRDCKSRYYGSIAKLQLPAKCSHDGQIAAVTVWLTAERANGSRACFMPTECENYRKTFWNTSLEYTIHEYRIQLRVISSSAISGITRLSWNNS